MDICINIEGQKLNIRAAAIIIHNNKMLTHKSTNKDHYALIGGRVQIGENSEVTLKREIMEEIGKEIEITGYISTIENFFEFESEKYHEIMFIYKAEFVNEEDKKIENTLENLEGKDYLKYEWIDLEKIDKYDIKPKVIKEIIKEGRFPVHKINNDFVKERSLK